MRLTTLRITSTRTAAARLDNNRRTLLPFSDVGALLATGESWQDHAADPGELLTPTHAPTATGPLTKRLATMNQVYVNYATRAKELNTAQPPIPQLLTTPSPLSSATGTSSVPLLKRTSSGASNSAS